MARWLRYVLVVHHRHGDLMVPAPHIVLYATLNRNFSSSVRWTLWIEVRVAHAAMTPAVFTAVPFKRPGNVLQLEGAYAEPSMAVKKVRIILGWVIEWYYSSTVHWSKLEAQCHDTTGALSGSAVNKWSPAQIATLRRPRRPSPRPRGMFCLDNNI